MLKHGEAVLASGYGQVDQPPHRDLDEHALHPRPGPSNVRQVQGPSLRRTGHTRSHSTEVDARYTLCFLAMSYFLLQISDAHQYGAKQVAFLASFSGTSCIKLPPIPAGSASWGSSLGLNVQIAVHEFMRRPLLTHLIVTVSRLVLKIPICCAPGERWERWAREPPTTVYHSHPHLPQSRSTPNPDSISDYMQIVSEGVHKQDQVALHGVGLGSPACNQIFIMGSSTQHRRWTSASLKL